MARTKIVKTILTKHKPKGNNVSIAVGRPLTLTEMVELKREGISYQEEGWPLNSLGYIKFTWGTSL